MSLIFIFKTQFNHPLILKSNYFYNFIWTLNNNKKSLIIQQILIPLKIPTLNKINPNNNQLTNPTITLKRHNFRILQMVKSKNLFKCLLKFLKSCLLINRISLNNFLILNFLKNSNNTKIMIKMIFLKKNNPVVLIKIIKDFIFAAKNVKQPVNLRTRHVCVLYQEDKEEWNLHLLVVEFVGVKDVPKRTKNILMIEILKNIQQTIVKGSDRDRWILKILKDQEVLTQMKMFNWITFKTQS